MYYIHGFGSNKDTNTGKLLAKTFDNVKVLEYDSNDFCQENLKTLKDQITEDELIVGSSLGGFYAALLAKKAVLINPCNFPSIFLEDKLPKSVVESYEINIPIDIPRLVIIGLQDKVINPELNAAFWKPKAKVIYGNFGHRINSFEPFKKEIQEFENFEAF